MGFVRKAFRSALACMSTACFIRLLPTRCGEEEAQRERRRPAEGSSRQHARADTREFRPDADLDPRRAGNSPPAVPVAVAAVTGLRRGRVARASVGETYV